jgi:glutaredoxin
MSDRDKINELAKIFEETGKAHHGAFIQTDGVDPDWPIWYADYLHERLQPFVAAPLTRSRLVFCLVETDDEHRATSSNTPWPEFYAKRLIECLGPAQEPATDTLTLYHFHGCPFCTRVRQAIDRLGLHVELRDIRTDVGHTDELLRARGRATVPVLRITSTGGEDRWMPESADIVRYLEATYGDAAA